MKRNSKNGSAILIPLHRKNSHIKYVDMGLTFVKNDNQSVVFGGRVLRIWSWTNIAKENNQNLIKYSSYQSFYQIKIINDEIMYF